MKEGDTYNAANINSEIDAAITDVNNLTLATHVRPRALGRHHLRSILADDEGEDKNNGHGMLVHIPNANWSNTSAFVEFSNELNGPPASPAAGGHPRNFQTVFGIGPGDGIGWRLVSRDGTVGNMCHVQWPATGSTWPNYNSVLISASVCIGKNARAGQINSEAQNCFALSLVIEDSLGNYYCVPRTIRFFNAQTSVGERLSLTALLFPADLAAAAASHGGSANVRRVILAFGRLDPSSTPVVINGKGYVEIGPFNITQMPLKHGTLT